MAETLLNHEKDIRGFDAGIDSVTIVNYIAGIPGGRSLDVTGYKPTTIKAGHVVIQETATGGYKPMPINEAGDAYAALPAGHVIKGVVVASVVTELAMVGIMYDGSVNEVTSPYPVTSTIKAALPNIYFTQD